MRLPPLLQDEAPVRLHLPSEVARGTLKRVSRQVSAGTKASGHEDAKHFGNRTYEVCFAIALSLRRSTRERVVRGHVR